MAPYYWPGLSDEGYSCSIGGAGSLQPATSYHYHLAALEPSTGRAIDSWKGASNNSNNGVVFLRAIDRGLLLGHDGTRVGNYLTGRSAFMDLGPTFNA